MDYEVHGKVLTADEMADYISANILIHYGTPRHSGRYPWGSGENPYQHNQKFLHYVSSQRKAGVSDGEIAQALGYKSSVELRASIVSIVIFGRESIFKDEYISEGLK